MNLTPDERAAIAREVTSGRLLSDVARDHDVTADTVRAIAAGRPDQKQVNPDMPSDLPAEVNGNDVPGWEGTVGPGPGAYGRLHVYARSVQSGAANCVCGRDPAHALHVPTPFAPGGYTGKVN